MKCLLPCRPVVRRKATPSSCPSKADVQTAAIRDAAARRKTSDCTGEDLLALLGLVSDPADPLAVGVQRFACRNSKLERDASGALLAPVTKVLDQEHWRRHRSLLIQRTVAPLQSAPPPRQGSDEGEMTARSQMSTETSDLSEEGAPAVVAWL